jgi:hypothetical protein
MEAGCTPKLDSCRCSLKTMGFEMSIVAGRVGKSTEGRRRLLVGRYIVYDLSFDGEDGKEGEGDWSAASWRSLQLRKGYVAARSPICVCLSD